MLQVYNVQNINMASQKRTHASHKKVSILFSHTHQKGTSEKSSTHTRTSYSSFSHEHDHHDGVYMWHNKYIYEKA